MSQTVYQKSFTCIVSLFFLVILAGCASTSSDTGMGVPPVSNSVESHSDIVIPADLEWDSSKSMAIKTASFTGGIYHYSGRVDIHSLKEFITSSMANNKWKLVGEASYKNIMIAFVKPNKTCMVTLSEGFGGFMGKTHVDLYVTVDLVAAKGLNPFGEPVN